jgi:hypothetical protein
MNIGGTRRDSKLLRVYAHGAPQKEWAWVTSEPAATLAAVEIARALVASGRPDAKIHHETYQQINTATAAQWVQAAAETNFE